MLTCRERNGSAAQPLHRVRPGTPLSSLRPRRLGEAKDESSYSSRSWKDPALTEKGRAEALEGGKNLKAAGLTSFDIAFTSVLQRANTTLDIILEEIGQKGLETHKDQALNERDYGELTGLNKDDGAFPRAAIPSRDTGH